MSDEITAKGQCLCGAVRFEIAVEEQSVALCHCKMCRQWCGGLPFAMFNAKVALHEHAQLRWYKSSLWGERGFCGDCGASLFGRMPGAEWWAVSAAAVDDDFTQQIASHVHADGKPEFYDFADDAPQQTAIQTAAFVFSYLKTSYDDAFLDNALAQLRTHNGDAFADAVVREIVKN